MPDCRGTEHAARPTLSALGQSHKTLTRARETRLKALGRDIRGTESPFLPSRNSAHRSLIPVKPAVTSGSANMSHAPRDPNDPQWKGKGRAVPSQSAPELTHAGISVASGHRTNQHASSLPENLPEPWVHLNDHYYRFMSPKQQERRDIILQFWKQGLAQALKMAALPGPAGLMMADQYFAQDRVMRHGNLEADGDTFRANILFMRKLENSLNLYRASMKLERREDSRNMIYNLCREACQDGPEVCTRTHQSGKQIEELFDSVFGPCRDADVPSVRGPAVDITFHNVNRPEAKRPELNVAHTHGPQPGQLLHLTQGALAGRPQLQNDPINSVTVDEHRGDASMLNGLKAKSCRKNEDPAYGASDEAGKLGKREADRQAQRRHTILKHEVEKRRELSKGEAIAVLTKMQQKRCQGSSTVVTIQDYVRARSAAPPMLHDPRLCHRKAVDQYADHSTGYLMQQRRPRGSRSP